MVISYAIAGRTPVLCSYRRYMTCTIPTNNTYYNDVSGSYSDYAIAILPTNVLPIGERAHGIRFDSKVGPWWYDWTGLRCWLYPQDLDRLILRSKVCAETRTNATSIFSIVFIHSVSAAHGWELQEVASWSWLFTNSGGVSPLLAIHDKVIFAGCGAKKVTFVQISIAVECANDTTAKEVPYFWSPC